MQKLLTFFSAKILACMRYLMIKVFNTLTSDIVSFELLGPDVELNVSSAFTH